MPYHTAPVAPRITQPYNPADFRGCAAYSSERASAYRFGGDPASSFDSIVTHPPVSNSDLYGQIVRTYHNADAERFTPDITEREHALRNLSFAPLGVDQFLAHSNPTMSASYRRHAPFTYARQPSHEQFQECLRVLNPQYGAIRAENARREFDAVLALGFRSAHGERGLTTVKENIRRANEHSISYMRTIEDGMQRAFSGSFPHDGVFVGADISGSHEPATEFVKHRVRERGNLAGIF